MTFFLWCFFSTTPTSNSGKHLPQLKLNKFDFVLFRAQFPALVEHMSAVLSSSASSHHAFSDVFPVLLILKKLHVSLPDPVSDLLFEKCLALSGDRNQMIRHCAAKAAAALCLPSLLAQQASVAVGRALDVLLSNTNQAYGMM